MQLLTNIGTLVPCRTGRRQGDFEQVADAALAWDNGSIVWLGPAAEIPSPLESAHRLDAGGGTVIPGLIDCHTHLAFGGWRADEFEQRCRGMSYLEIAKAGGGILSTVRATRATNADILEHQAVQVLDEMLQLGMTTVEVKSGYGLDLETELRLLRVYQRLDATHPIRLIPTLLGAHVVPPEFREDRDAYVDLVITEMIPAAAHGGLAKFCDVFIENGAFTPAEARRILEAGAAAGLAPKVHADQLADGNGAEVAALLGAVSADHLEHISSSGIAALKGAGTVAVALPLATLYLGQPPMPARRLLDAGVPVAVATDFNPGSAPSAHLPLALMLACTLLGMTPAEALDGATIFAARAVGVADRVGSLEVGKAADFAVLDAPSVNQWLYHFRANACVMTVIDGAVRWRREDRGVPSSSHVERKA